MDTVAHEQPFDSHFFIIAVNHARNWAKELRDLDSRFLATIEVFLGATGDVELVRNMLEHEVAYFKLEGRKQDEYLQDVLLNSKEFFLEGARPHVNVVSNEGLQIGGRISLRKAAGAVAALRASL